MPSTASRDRAALAVLAAGAVVIVLVAAPYKAFELDRYFVPKELVLHLSAAVAAFLCVSSRRKFALTGVDVLLAAFLLVSVGSAILATNGWLALRASSRTRGRAPRAAAGAPACCATARCSNRPA